MTTMLSLNVPSSSVAIDQLMQQNIATRKELETWIEDQKRTILMEKRTHTTQLEDMAQQTSDAARRTEQYKQQHNALSMHCKEQQAQMHANQVEMEVLQSEKQRKEPVVQDLLTKKQAEHDRVHALEQETTRQRMLQQEQLLELQRGIAMYQRLGLEFERSPANDKMMVRFTQIDPQDPKRVFACRIRLHPETDRFIIDACHPSVAQLDNAVDRLNTTCDLSWFIRYMRRQFRRLV